MATAAQVKANRENAKKSSGPTSEAGKEASSLNNFRYGLTGHAFLFLEWENPEVFDAMKAALTAEHKPATVTEHILVEKMAQYYWLSQRAVELQTVEMFQDPYDAERHQRIANFARYQALHDRLYQRALHDLLKLRAERRKEQIGFESQKRAAAEEARRAELQPYKLATAKTRAERAQSHTPTPARKAAAQTERMETPQNVPIAA